MKRILEKQMLWIVIFLTAISTIYPFYFGGSWDLNRSIGWGWDITNYMFWWTSTINYIFSFLVIAAYGFIYFTNRITNFYLSAIHICLLLISIFIYIPGEFLFLNEVFIISILIVFLLNLILSQKDIPASKN